MDIKLVILLAVAIAIIFLLMNEMNTLREDLDKRMTDLNNRISKYNEDTKATFRKEARDVSSKYKTYTTEMMKELRIMNSIENQAITHMSDQFAEADADAESADRNIPHLSDMNLPRLQAQQAQLARGQVVYSRDTHSKEVREVVDLDNADGANNTANVDIVVGKNDRNEDVAADADEEYYMSSETAEFKLKEDGETLPSAHEEADHTDYDTEDLDEDADYGEGDEGEEGEEGEEGTGDVDDDESDIDEEGEGDSENEDEESAEPEAETNEAGDVDNADIENDGVGEVEVVIVKEVSRNHQKIRASMEDDDDDDDDFSVENDEVEDIENTGESISISTQEEFRLKSISRYSKQQLVEIANTRGVKISVRSNKNVIYNQIKATL